MDTRVCRLYGQDDLRIEEDHLPGLEADEVLIKMAAGGICGSDLHYYNHGGFGDIRVIDPIILGHEIAGVVHEIGENCHGLLIGDIVAINPSTPCEICEYCQQGLQQHCLDMLFLGSAMRRPHVQGGFRDYLIAKKRQCLVLSKDTAPSFAAMAEPLSVCLHAANRAGDLQGRRVLITGAGPIGCLSVCVAKYLGASEIVVTDLEDQTLSIAREVGATSTINIRTNSEALKQYSQAKGYFDVGFECSGARLAIEQCIELLQPQATLVQVGNVSSSAVSLPYNRIVAKELGIHGSFRFFNEFKEAAHLIDKRSIDVSPLITDTLPLEDAAQAFHLANDRSRSVKVTLSFL